MRGKFGELLAQQRREKRVTLRKLGQLVGLSPSFLSEIETGRRLPPKDEGKIRDLALVLGMDQDYFVTAAHKERATKNTKFFEKIFNSDAESAYAFCRMAEEVPAEDLTQVIKDMMTRLENRGVS
jgi:transcriptional regulator with XRE-family HTH domain